MIAPRLLLGHTLQERARLRPSSMSVTLNYAPTSSASITLAPTEPQVAVGDWMRLYTVQGDAGVFVVNTIQTDCVTGVRTISLEHVFGALRRMIIFGSMGGSKASATATIRAVLDKQTEKIWTLGTCGYDDVKPWKFNNVTIFDAMNTIANSLEKAQFSFDCSALPFKISITPRSETVACEMRMNRGISTMSQTVDTTDMFTRIYPVGMKELHVPAGYLEKNVDKYGIIEKTQTDQSISDVTLLESWAREQLNKFAEPQVSVSVSGVELSKITGLAFDRLVPGTTCRIPLPKFGTTVIGYIQTVAFSDVVNNEAAVQVTLGNKRTNVASIIQQVKSGGGGGATATNEELSLFGTAINTSKQEISLIAWRTTALETTAAALRIRADQIESTVNTHTNGLNAQASAINQLANKISLVVQENGAGGLVINEASIVAAINNGSSSVQIKADKINLYGSVWADELSAARADLMNLKTGVTVASALHAQMVVAGTLKVGGFTYYRRSVTINGTTYNILAQ